MGLWYLTPAGAGTWLTQSLGKMFLGGQTPEATFTIPPSLQPVADWMITYGPWIVAGIIAILAIVLALYFGKDIIIVKIMEWAKENFL